MNIMTKKRRRTFFDDFFDEIDKMFERMMKSMSFFGADIDEFGSGSWSIQITQSPDGKTTIYAELGPDVDREKFIEKIKIIREETKEKEEPREKKGKFFKLFAEEEKGESKLFKVIKIEKEDE